VQTSLNIDLRLEGILNCVVGVIDIPMVVSGISIYTIGDLQVYQQLTRVVRHLYIFKLRVGGLPISVIPSFGFGVDRVCVRVRECVSSWCFVSVLIQPVTDTRKGHFLVISHICYD